MPPDHDGLGGPLQRVRDMNASEMSEELAGRCESLCAELFPNGHRERNEFLVGNVCGDEGRSLSVRLTGEKAGVWADFANGESDVLVCTTIIESGLDMPNVNTIIIDRADRFGLSQLYQLRGRVGRGDHRA